MDQPVIIICSGNSIPFNTNRFRIDGNGLPTEFKRRVETNYSIGINSFYKFGTSETTWVQFGDAKFYLLNLEHLKRLPLIIGKHDVKIENIVLPNTILLSRSRTYDLKNCWKTHQKRCVVCNHIVERRTLKCPKCSNHIFLETGFYHHWLTVLSTLTLCLAIGFKKIFICGMDCCAIDGKTHFYQDLIDIHEKPKAGGQREWSGVGIKSSRYSTSAYNNPTNLNDNWFAPYQEALDRGIEIYNVSPASVINVFPKITYDTFYSMVPVLKTNQHFYQNIITNIIKEKTKNA